MRITLCFVGLITVFCLGLAPAAAQTKTQPYNPDQRATGETYHVEFSANYFWASPTITFNVKSVDIPGSVIDGVQDLGFESERFRDYRLVVRPAKKHKFLFSYNPIKYTGDTVLERDIVFNGETYHVGFPVQSELELKSRRIGYEYDFLYRSRGFVGFLVGVDLARVSASLQSPLLHGSMSESTPAPLLGGIARVYPIKNTSITLRIQGFKLPESTGDRRYSLRIFDVDFYGTVNFTDNFGAQGGYRSFHVTYRVKEDSGDFLAKGYYLGAVVRF
jgi:hypothetical protein